MMGNNMSKPLLAVTMGDPAGVGAEIVVKTFANAHIFDHAQPFVIGSVACLKQAVEQIGVSVDIEAVESATEVTQKKNIQVLEPISFDISMVKECQIYIIVHSKH